MIYRGKTLLCILLLRNVLWSAVYRCRWKATECSFNLLLIVVVISLANHPRTLHSVAVLAGFPRNIFVVELLTRTFHGSDSESGMTQFSRFYSFSPKSHTAVELWSVIRKKCLLKSAVLSDTWSLTPTSTLQVVLIHYRFGAVRCSHKTKISNYLQRAK